MTKTKTLPAVATVLLSLTVTVPVTGDYILLKDVLGTSGGQVSSASYLLG